MRVALYVLCVAICWSHDAPHLRILTVLNQLNHSIALCNPRCDSACKVHPSNASCRGSCGPCTSADQATTTIRTTEHEFVAVRDCTLGIPTSIIQELDWKVVATLALTEQHMLEWKAYRLAEDQPVEMMVKNYLHVPVVLCHDGSGCNPEAIQPGGEQRFSSYSEHAFLVQSSEQLPTVIDWIRVRSTGVRTARELLSKIGMSRGGAIQRVDPSFDRQSLRSAGTLLQSRESSG